MATVILERLRYPREFVAACRVLVQEHMFRYESAWKPATVRRLMRRMGTAQMLDDLLLLREADCRSRDLASGLAELEELRDRVEAERRAAATLHITDLAVDGSDVMRVLGIGPGPGVGRALEQMLERVTDDPSLNERRALTRLLREMKVDEDG
jgi:tRNA nucleotidyltransferase (CCA-adding enzyme)